MQIAVNAVNWGDSITGIATSIYVWRNVSIIVDDYPVKEVFQYSIISLSL